MLDNAVAVVNAKGGTLKTSITANVGGLLALAGWRVLLVDLDSQANLGRDLGYIGQSDGGSALLEAYPGALATAPLKEVRERLDVVPAGPGLSDLFALVSARHGDLDDFLVGMLAGLASEYDIVLFDCPPSAGPAQDAALAAAHYLVVPVTLDSASTEDGLANLSLALERASAINPGLALLGVCVTNISTQSRALRDETRGDVERILGGAAPVFDAVIRHTERSARDCRLSGRLAHEYEADTRKDKAKRFVWLRQGRGSSLASPKFGSEASEGLAQDYAELAKEISDAFVAAQNKAGAPA